MKIKNNVKCFISMIAIILYPSMFMYFHNMSEGHFIEILPSIGKNLIENTAAKPVRGLKALFIHRKLPKCSRGKGTLSPFPFQKRHPAPAGLQLKPVPVKPGLRRGKVTFPKFMAVPVHAAPEHAADHIVFALIILHPQVGRGAS